MKWLTGLVAVTFVLGFTYVTLTFAGGGPRSETKTDTMSDTQIQTAPSTIAPQRVAGKLLKIDGEFYVVEDMTGKQVRLHVNDETQQMGSPKKPGDTILAEVTKSGHAVSIR